MKTKILSIILISYIAIFMVNTLGNSFGDKVKTKSLLNAYSEFDINISNTNNTQELLTVINSTEARIANKKASENAGKLLTLSLFLQGAAILAIAAFSTFLIFRLSNAQTQP